jgi:hypothetical protein
VILPTLSGGMSWDTTSLYSTGVVIVVPEPGTGALVAAMGVIVGLGSWLRRSRRSLRE